MTQDKKAENIEKKQVKLRLQFIHKPLKKKLFRKLFKKQQHFLIQNKPVEYGLKITNIGSDTFSGATISEFAIDFLGGVDMHHKTNKTKKIKALNPGEEFEIYIDELTLRHEGSIGTHCTLIPDSELEEITCFQCHENHGSDEPCFGLPFNEWWHDYYCQSQQQLLQTRTNNLILLLTIITVLEAIFGLTNILKLSSSILAWGFSQLVTLFSWLAG